MEIPESLFERRGANVLVPTELCRGPWSHGHLHGGAVTGALGWALEGIAPGDDQLLARMTVEILSMVPLVPLDVRAELIKRGRRTSTGTASLGHDGRVVARAHAQWAAPGAAWPEPPGEVPLLPVVYSDPGASTEIDYPRPGFNCDAVELRPLSGSTEEPGPGLVWVRLRPDVVEGQRPSPLGRITALCDLGIAVGWDHAPSGASFINPDVTLQLSRYPIGDWVLFDSRSHVSSGGLGFCETRLGDEAGPFGRVLQTLVEAPTELSVFASNP